MTSAADEFKAGIARDDDQCRTESTSGPTTDSTPRTTLHHMRDTQIVGLSETHTPLISAQKKPDDRQLTLL